MNATTTELLTAARTAAETIEKAAADNGTTFGAEQDSYGVEYEALVGDDWVRMGEVEEGAVVEAVRLFDCDGNRGAECRTPAEVEAEVANWVE